MQVPVERMEEKIVEVPVAVEAITCSHLCCQSKTSCLSSLSVDSHWSSFSGVWMSRNSVSSFTRI